MPVSKNKVNWGLAKVYWGQITVNEQGIDTYSEPVKLVGSRVINFSPQGDLVEVYADGGTIYTGRENNGYEGSLEMTVLDDDLIKYALDEETDDSNIQFEKKKTTQNRFFLMWEWENDTRNTRHCMLNVTANRVSIESTTAGDGGTKSAQYETLQLRSLPRDSDGYVKYKTTYQTDSTAYSTFFDAVKAPNFNFTITTDVEDVTKTTAEDASLSFVVTTTKEGADIKYQWYSTTSISADGTAIEGATNSEYEIPNTLEAGTYYYYCVASADGVNDKKSAVSTVTVTGA